MNIIRTNRFDHQRDRLRSYHAGLREINNMPGGMKCLRRNSNPEGEAMPVGCARSGYAGEKDRHFHSLTTERRGQRMDCVGVTAGETAPIHERLGWRADDQRRGQDLRSGVSRMTVIRTNRFDSDRNRRAAHDREYDEGMRETNARYPEQLEATRGPDCIDDDVSFMMRVAGVIVGGLVFAIFLYAWLAGPIEVTL